MNLLLLLDVAPDPLPTGIGMTGIILVAFIVLILVGALLTGFVFLLRRLTKTAGAGTRVVIGDACLNLDSLSSRSNRVTSQPIISTAQPGNSPNQP